MILLILLVLVPAAIAVLFLHLGRAPNSRSLWRRILSIGLGLGIARASLASWGWYTVEHTGGPLQTPAFALAMLAWPEAIALDYYPRLALAPPGFYLLLSVVLVLSTLAVVTVVGMAVQSKSSRLRR